MLAPNFEFYSFPVPKDETLIGIIVEKEAAFWSLIEAKKLPDPLPNLNDDRCSTCIFRKTCRGEAYAEANARIPVRDKRSGVQYAQITDPEFVQVVADRLQVMKGIEEQEEILAGITNEIKQRWPAEVGAVQIPGHRRSRSAGAGRRAQRAGIRPRLTQTILNWWMDTRRRRLRPGLLFSR